LTPPHAEVITSSSSITWVANDEVGDVRSGFRNAEMSITDTVNDVVVFSDTVIGGAGVNQITDFASLGLSAGEYMAYMQVWDNACNLEAIREFFTVGEGGNSWLMTEYGDSFAKDGYSDIQMGATSNTSNGNLNTLYPPEGATNPFSRYIISSKNTTLTSDPSRRDYELVSSSGYDDQNMKKFSPTFSVYNFLMDIVDAPINEISANDWSQLQHGVNIYKAGGEYDGSLTIPAGATCNHQAVVFVEGNLTLDASFKINDSDPVINGCLFVVKGNTIVSSGGAGGINFMDGFFVTDGTFTTECGGTLVIKGGVLTGTASFGCPGDGSNPGEIIDYDARYLDILRAYLGADYPYRIREWKYSTAD
jgi:hypothetical protein